jgi:hypothetical protein
MTEIEMELEKVRGELRVLQMAFSLNALELKHWQDKWEYEAMRLAAVGVAVYDGREEQALGPENPYYSAAYRDVLELRRAHDKLLYATKGVQNEKDE